MSSQPAIARVAAGHRPRISFLGYPVDNLTLPGAVGRVLEFVREPALHHVAVLNANKLWLAARNPELQRILRAAELVVPEYAPVWGSRVVGTPLPESIRGISLVEALLPALAENRLSVYFFGAAPQVIIRLKEKVAAIHPGLPIAGARCGYFEAAQESSIISEINAARPAVLIVCLGSPRQELWIEKHRSDLAVPVAMGAGGTFDVLAGFKKDAPPWTRHGLEWLFRLSQDPANLWKRYLITNPWFVAQVLRARFSFRQSNAQKNFP